MIVYVLNICLLVGSDTIVAYLQHLGYNWVWLFGETQLYYFLEHLLPFQERALTCEFDIEQVFEFLSRFLYLGACPNYVWW